MHCAGGYFSTELAAQLAKLLQALDASVRAGGLMLALGLMPGLGLMPALALMPGIVILGLMPGIRSFMPAPVK